jgi:acetylornithine deacetylase/succinyl-diaminopimelate desuccinylase-like protein
VRLRDPLGKLGATALTLVALTAAPAQAADSAVTLLQRYLRIDTSNPPGGEAPAAGFLADLIHRQGLETQLLVSPGGRTSLYARLDGGAQAKGAIVLLHHMDVVPPAPSWSTLPFSGDRGEGFIWGAGAVDDKSLGISHLVAFLELARSEQPLAHHVIFLAVADEETGGAEGTAWLLERHSNLFEDTVAVLTEGGNNRAFRGRLAWWGVEVGQKRPLWLQVSTRGRAGHGSTADLATAPSQLLRGLARLFERKREYRITNEARSFFESLEQLTPSDKKPWLDRVARAIERGTVERQLAPGQHGLFLDTIQVTVLEAGRQVNAVPARALAMIDIRLLPDTDTDQMLAAVRELLGPDISVKVLLKAAQVEPTSIDTSMYACLETALEVRAPVVPSFIAGVTDARYFRERGIPAYGFSPFALSPGDAQGVHGVDEKISERAFERGVTTMTELVSSCTRIPTR